MNPVNSTTTLPDTGTPLAAARAAFDALNRCDWRTAAALVDPADVEAWYRRYLENEADHEPTIDEVLASDPSVSRAVAEDRLESLRRITALYTGIGRDFVEFSTREQLADLSPLDALARYFRAQDPALRFALHERRLSSTPETLAAFGPPCAEPITRLRAVTGLLHQTDDLASVAYRRYWSDVEPEDAAAEAHVAQLRRTRDGWRLRLAGELLEENAFTVVAEAVSG